MLWLHLSTVTLKEHGNSQQHTVCIYLKHWFNKEEKLTTKSRR